MSDLIPYAVKVIEEAENHNHIPGLHSATICGFVDVKTENVPLEDNPIDCPTCIEMVRYCRDLRFRPNRIETEENQ